MTPIFYTIDPEVSSTNSRVKSKRCHRPKNQYTILNYEKGFVCFDDKISPLYRSVIMDANTQAIYAFSPPKSSSVFAPDDYHKPLDPDRWIVNEIIEGSMVNLWYDRTAGFWEISTKTDVGGEYVYFRHDLSDGSDTDETADTPFIGQVTYKNMFLDTICNGTHIQNINDLLFLKEWDTRYCYSFVLQHPYNHLVLNIERPCLYLVAVYDTSFHMVYEIRPDTYRMWEWLAKCTWICYPQPQVLDKTTTYASLVDLYSSIHGSSDVVGVMMTDWTTGVRYKIVNTVYMGRKELCRNDSCIFYQYLCIRYLNNPTNSYVVLQNIQERSGQTMVRSATRNVSHQQLTEGAHSSFAQSPSLCSLNKLNDFLEKYPSYRRVFERLDILVAQFIYNIYRSYQSRYMKRTGEVISHRYMPHVYNIHHMVYLPSVANGQKRKITMQVVQEYLNAMTPTELYHALYQ